MNVSDSERIAAFLEKHGLKPAKDMRQADLAVFNTCGVRQMAEDWVYGQIHNVRKQESGIKNQEKKRIILTGCLANRKDVKRRLKDKVDLFSRIDDIFMNLSELLITNYKLRSKPNCTALQYLKIRPKYSHNDKSFVPIMTGCNNFCSYCVVPYARGREVSRPLDDIISEIENLAKNGCKEITLLGQNVNSYKYVNRRMNNPNYQLPITNSAQITFPILLNLLALNFSEISFRFLTSHPKDFSDDLIDVIAKNKNIAREIHLPVQSGSDKVLKLMNRPYTRKKYLSLIRKIKKKIPQASFTTDVIVGFPGETEKDFQKTVEVFKSVNYNEAYINKYSPRPGTAAWKLGDRVPLEEKKRREKVLRNLI